MTEEEKLAYVNYRIKSAFKTFDAARVLADNGFGTRPSTDFIILYFMRLMPC